MKLHSGLGATPGRKREQLVVGDVKESQVLVSHQQSAAVLVQVVTRQVELLERAEALHGLAARRNTLQGVG